MGLIVKARSDGRGGIKPFGTFDKKQFGAIVYIGDREFKVTKDGRVNIPKSIMETGVKGNDGRFRIEIGFRTNPGIEHWRQVEAKVSKPFDENKDKDTYQKATHAAIKTGKTSEDMIGALESGLETGEYLPSDTGEKNYSP